MQVNARKGGKEGVGMKADRERLAKIIGDIEKYFADLEVLDLRRQDLSEKRNF